MSVATPLSPPGRQPSCQGLPFLPPKLFHRPTVFPNPNSTPSNEQFIRTVLPLLTRLWPRLHSALDIGSDLSHHLGNGLQHFLHRSDWRQARPSLGIAIRSENNPTPNIQQLPLCSTVGCSETMSCIRHDWARHASVRTSSFRLPMSAPEDLCRSSKPTTSVCQQDQYARSLLWTFYVLVTYCFRHFQKPRASYH